MIGATNEQKRLIFGGDTIQTLIVGHFSTSLAITEYGSRILADYLALLRHLSAASFHETRRSEMINA